MRQPIYQANACTSKRFGGAIIAAAAIHNELHSKQQGSKSQVTNHG